MPTLSMSVALITGANRGLGFEFARQYLGDGWRVFAACRDPAAASKLQRLSKSAGGRLDIIATDVTDLTSVKTAAAQLKDIAIDLVINCAGITGVSGQKVRRVDYDSWAHVLDVNTMGPLRVIESFTDQVARSERRLVVTITSGMGSLRDNTTGGSIAYRSSKAAVNMVMRSAAIDLAPQRITCDVINPGWVKTDMGGLNATLTPQESVTAMRRLIEKLGPDQSGKFFHYDGTEHPMVTVARLVAPAPATIPFQKESQFIYLVPPSRRLVSASKITTHRRLRRYSRPGGAGDPQSDRS
jgi:NAD(P)-dependent dehydrogenase (short-subunit alcohol dehydrogenase family)